MVFLNGLKEAGQSTYVKVDPDGVNDSRLLFAADKAVVEAILKADQSRFRPAGNLDYLGQTVTVNYFRSTITQVGLDGLKFNYSP